MVKTTKRAVIDTTSSTDLSVVAAITNAKIAVHGYVLAGNNVGNAHAWRWEDGAGGTALSGVMKTSGNHIVVPFSEHPWIKTSVNTALSLEVIGAAAGHIIYSEEY